MKRLALILLALPVLALGGYAQQMYPNYSSYSSFSTNGLTVYASVTVDGSTTGSLCNQYGCIPSPNHTPYASSTIKNTNTGVVVGGLKAGNQVLWNAYISYTNTATQNLTTGINYLFAQYTQVYCSAVGLFYTSPTTTATDYAGKCPTGAAVHVYVPAQSQKCDGNTTYNAGLSIGGVGAPQVTDVTLTTTTDNVLVIDLLGSPVGNPLCSNKSGSPQWCYQQGYKAYFYAQNPKGNINWNTKIWCGAKVNPDITGNVPQSFTCN